MAKSIVTASPFKRRGPQPQDLSGRRFARWTVESYAGRVLPYKIMWNCRCDCGTCSIVDGHHLKSGGSRSCGCLKREMSRQRFTRHGLSHLPEYAVWGGMITRCHNPKRRTYSNYGGRGIAVCEWWLGDDGFMNFLADMGRRPSPKHTVERIDNDKGYGPDNCRWATWKEQANNRRPRATVTCWGQTKSLAEWSKEVGIEYRIVAWRIYGGKWSPERALTQRPRQKTPCT